MKNKLSVIFKALFPIPLYFLLGYFLQSYLQKYTIVGPVNSESGQPIFSNYSAFLYYGFIALIAAGFIYAFVQAIKAKGWPRYVCFAVAILFLPIQYIFLIGVQIALFGK